MNIILTSFEPFDGKKINPTQKVASILKNRNFHSTDIHYVELPVTIDCANILLDKISSIEKNIDAIIMLGYTDASSSLRIERVGLNFDCFPIKDNSGNLILDEKIDMQGEAAYFSTLPTRKILNKLRNTDIDVQLSYSAGTFICNHLYYTILKKIHELYFSSIIPCGFIHIPSTSKKWTYRRLAYCITEAIQITIDEININTL